MHADQVDLPVEAVAALVAAQFPGWTGAVRQVPSEGTVNALFRLGDEIVLRFPLCPRSDPQLRAELLHEQKLARRTAARTHLEVPEPLALGEPAAEYPGWWTAYRWIPGESARTGGIGDPVAFAADLARFVRDVHAMPSEGGHWDGHSRGGPLSTRIEDVERALAGSAGLVDVPAIRRAWRRCLAAEAHRGPDMWLHADLMPGNLLTRDGRLVAVIDLGAACLGDPAVDLMPAWNLLPTDAREAFRRALAVDDATWERGRGWAIIQAIVALPYYRHTNPGMAATARHTLAAVLE